MVVRYWTEHYFDARRMGGAMPPAMTWLVRHGQSASNAGLPAVGHGDGTADGARPASRRVRWPRRVERQPDLLIVSPFLPRPGDRRADPRTLAAGALRDLADPGADLPQPGALHGTTAGDPPAVDRGLLARLRSGLSRWSGCRNPSGLHGKARRLSSPPVGARRRLRESPSATAIFRAPTCWAATGAFAVAAAWMRTIGLAETSQPMADW